MKRNPSKADSSEIQKGLEGSEAQRIPEASKLEDNEIKVIEKTCQFLKNDDINTSDFDEAPISSKFDTNLLDKLFPERDKVKVSF